MQLSSEEKIRIVSSFLFDTNTYVQIHEYVH